MLTKLEKQVRAVIESGEDLIGARFDFAKNVNLKTLENLIAVARAAKEYVKFSSGSGTAYDLTLAEDLENSLVPLEDS